jgi:uncharacterized protein (TIGR03083 family)
MTRMHGTKEFWLSSLQVDGPAFRSAAGEPDALLAPVPSCPGWQVDDLVFHLASIYHWVHGHVNRGVTSPPEPRPAVPRDLLPAGATALTWWDEEFEGLVALLGTLAPDALAWNWAPRPKTVEFWSRRMALETTIHRWDAQMAVGRAEPVETRLAADGVTEVIDSWLPSGRRRGPTDRYGVVQLTATDIDESWLVRLRGEGGMALLDTDTLLDADDPHARVFARGTASDLLLSLYGRIPFDVLEVSGDSSLLAALRTG